MKIYNYILTLFYSVNPNLRRHVFCYGVLNGGYNAWRYVYERRLNSNNQADEVAMLRPLGCTTDDKAIQEYAFLYIISILCIL